MNVKVTVVANLRKKNRPVRPRFGYQIIAETFEAPIQLITINIDNDKQGDDACYVCKCARFFVVLIQKPCDKGGGCSPPEFTDFPEIQVRKMEGGPNIQEADDCSRSLIENESEEENEEDCRYKCCDPRGRYHRFIALFFMCFIGFGSYFCYDNPAALQDNFITDLNITTTQFALFYSLYSWPNVVLCFVGGFLIDRVFGIRFGTNIYMFITLLGQILFALGAIINTMWIMCVGRFVFGLGTSIYIFITLLGQILFALGAIINTMWIMCVGRFVFGIGGESLAVAQNNYAVLWFKGKELNMVFGLQLSLARIGSTVNFWVMVPIYNWVAQTYQGYECLGIVLFLAGSTCLLSMTCSLILGCLDKNAERKLRRNQNQSEEVVRLRDVKDFPLTFWMLSVICVAYYVAIFPFIALGKKFFMERFNMTSTQANSVNSLLYLISGVAAPGLGILVDFLGRNVYWMLFAILLTAGAHGLLIFTMTNPYVGIVIMGLGYSVLASGLWPLVALLIPEHQLGTAYGICQAIQNLGLAVISILAGYIVDNAGYFWLEMFFLGCLGVAFGVTLLVWIVDTTRNGILNKTPKQRLERGTLIIAHDKERLLGEIESSSTNEMFPRSDFEIRNRYLSRIGAPLPANIRSSTFRGPPR